MTTLLFQNLLNGPEQVRTLVDSIAEEMSIMAGLTMRDDPHATTGPLLASWTSLVALLSPVGLRDTRVCPSCHRIGMSDATVCGYCWTKLARLDVAALAAAQTAPTPPTVVS